MNKKRTVIGIILVLIALTITVQTALAANTFNKEEIGRLTFFDGLEYRYYDTYMHLSLENEHNFPLSHVDIALWIPDLNIYSRTSSFTMYPGDSDFGKYIWVDFPYNVEPGTYLARVLLESEYDRSISWQYVDIY